MIPSAKSRMPLWVQQKIHPWWPSWLCLDSVMFWVLLVTFIIGGLIGWWMNRPPAAWLHFNWIEASYVGDASPYRIMITVQYQVESDCKEGLRANPIWRTQVITAEQEILTYAPDPTPPPFVSGSHDYTQVLTVEHPPEGWRMLFVAICPGETPETVPSELVTVVKREPDVRDMP